MDRYKVHFVVKGYTQKVDVDFKEVYNPIFKDFMIRMFLALTANFGWVRVYMNITNTFVNARVQEDLTFLSLKGLR